MVVAWDVLNSLETLIELAGGKLHGEENLCESICEASAWGPGDRAGRHWR